ncbi:hypothetical protein P4S55_07515 [Shewanella sp. PP-Sp27a-2]
MKEYIVTFTLNGRRQQQRVFAYHVSDAYKRIRDSLPSNSQISWASSKEVK